MATIHLRAALGTIFGAGLILGLGQAFADDLLKPSGTAGFSIALGFKQTSLPLLKRVAGGAPDAVSEALLQKLCSGQCPPLSRSAPINRVEAAGDTWSLQVLGDGTAARYRNMEVGGREHAIAKEKTQQMSAESLYRAGRDFIDAQLASVVVVGPEEKIVPVRTDYRVEGGTNLRTGETARSVVANRVVFGRTIRDVPVVGGGSRIALTFANDGSLESFQYDWPKYEYEAQSAERSVVDLEGILERVRRAVGLRLGVPSSTAPISAFGGQDASHGVELLTNTVLRKLECGYYDPGFSAREASAPVQPGCVYEAVSHDEAGGRSALSGAVPAATFVEADPSWPEAARLGAPAPNEIPAIPGPSQGR
jgi:hypothetical protein